MKRSRFTDDQIIGILKEHEAGISAIDLGRKHGISDATFYKWRAKYGGLDVSDAKRLTVSTIWAGNMLSVGSLDETSRRAPAGWPQIFQI